MSQLSGGCVSAGLPPGQNSLVSEGQQTAPGTTCGNHRANYSRHLRASPGMVFAVQVHEPTRRARRNPCRIPPHRRVSTAADDHGALGQGAGLVSAQDGDRAQGLHGGSRRMNAWRAGHRPGAQGQRQGDHGGRRLGHCRHDQADRGDDHQFGRLAAAQSDRQHMAHKTTMAAASACPTPIIRCCRGVSPAWPSSARRSVPLRCPCRWR